MATTTVADVLARHYSANLSKPWEFASPFALEALGAPILDTMTAADFRAVADGADEAESRALWGDALDDWDYI